MTGGSRRVLVTGHAGYIGSRLLPLLLDEGYTVVGLDSGLFRDCTFAGTEQPPVPHETLTMDIRDVTPAHLEGFDAVLHLAGLSSDPLGDLDAACTFAINHEGTVRVAEAAKTAGVERFVFSSSCSLYGRHGDALLDEQAAFNPVTPYGRSKVLAEQDLHLLADDDFTPTYLRNATAYGASWRLRGDLVVNNLVAYALTTGAVLMKSDGTPWRPLVHAEDLARAFVVTLGAPRELVHDEAFNVGATAENYQVRDVAALVEELVPGSAVRFAAGAGPDLRNYRVNCDKIAETLGYETRWTVRRGIEELVASYERGGLTEAMLHSSRLMRIQHVRELLERELVTTDLRWQVLPETTAGARHG